MYPFFFTSVSLVTGYVLHTLITVEVAVNLCRMIANFNVVFYAAGPVKYIGKNVLEEIFFFSFPSHHNALYYMAQG